MFPRNHHAAFQCHTIGRPGLLLLGIFLLLSSCVQPISRATEGAASTQQLDLEVVGHVGGAVLSIAVQDNYAYLGFSHELMVLDVHDPEQPRWLTSLPLPTNKLSIAEHYAYVVGRAGFAIVDLSDPASPRWISTIAAPYTATAVAVDGAIAHFIASNILYTVNISNPTQPTLIGKIRLAPRLVGLWADHGFVYVSSNKGFHVVDSTNPAQPKVAKQIDLISDGGSITPVRGYLYVTANNQLAIFSIANPSAPQIVKKIELDFSPNQIVTSGNCAYLANGSQGVARWDVTDPLQPTPIAIYPTPSYAVAVAVHDQLLYLVDIDEGLQIYKIAQTAELVALGNYTPLGLAMKSVIDQNTAFVIGGSTADIHCVDLTHLKLGQQIALHQQTGFIYDIFYLHPYLYAASESSGLQIFDLRDTDQPSVAAHPLSVSSIFAIPRYLYLGDRSGNLLILDATDPTHLLSVAAYPNVGYVNGMAIADGFAYLYHGELGMRIFKITATGELIEVGVYRSTERIQKILVIDSYAYLAGDTEIAIVDISDREAPFLAGHYRLPEQVLDLDWMGNYLLVANDIAGLRILDLTKPTQPRQVALYKTLDCATQVTAINDQIYVSDHLGGLWILQIK